MLRCKSLNSCLRANWRENWRDKVAMRGGKYACAGTILFSRDVEFKHERNYNGIDQRFAVDH